MVDQEDTVVDCFGEGQEEKEKEVDWRGHVGRTVMSLLVVPVTAVVALAGLEIYLIGKHLDTIVLV